MSSSCCQCFQNSQLSVPESSKKKLLPILLFRSISALNILLEQLLPKQLVLPQRPPLGITNGDQFSSPTINDGRMNGNLMQNAKSNGDVSSVLPMSYMIDGGSRGRRSAALEKVVGRRWKRMIKNRESVARSRARKQAYTIKLEEEVAKLKEENQELRK